MTLSVEKTVGEIAAECPAAVNVFEKHHIDYCCGGKHPISDACRGAGASVEEVMEEVEQAAKQRPGPEQADWSHEPLRKLIEYIVAGHHAWLRDQMPLIEHLMDRAAKLHGASRPESIVPLQRIFGRLRIELEEHMRKEEKILFPAIVRMESSVSAGGPVPPARFGSMRNPISLMEHDHDLAAQYLDELRDLTYGYSLPEDACLSFKALYRELQVLDADLRTHIHLENNILFPRAARMEREGS